MELQQTAMFIQCLQVYLARNDWKLLVQASIGKDGLKKDEESSHGQHWHFFTGIH